MGQWTAIAHHNAFMTRLDEFSVELDGPPFHAPLMELREQLYNFHALSPNGKIPCKAYANEVGVKEKPLSREEGNEH